MYLCICVSVYLCTCVPMYLCIYVTVYLCVCISMFLNICISVYLCMYLSIYRHSTFLFLRRSITAPLCASFSPIPKFARAHRGKEPRMHTHSLSLSLCYPSVPPTESATTRTPIHTTLSLSPSPPTPLPYSVSLALALSHRVRVQRRYGRQLLRSGFPMYIRTRTIRRGCRRCDSNRVWLDVVLHFRVGIH